MKTVAKDYADDDQEGDFKPLSAAEAHEWRKSNPQVSIWRILIAQALMTVLVTLIAGMVTKRAGLAWSVGYGGLVSLLPSLVYARGMMRQKNRHDPGVAMLGFFGTELIKIILTIAMLLAAPKVVNNLNWLALIVGMGLTMKTYWIALLVQSRKSKLN